MSELSEFMSSPAEIRMAGDVVLEVGFGQVSTLQRRMKIGYARAVFLLGDLERLGVVGPRGEGTAAWPVLMSAEKWAAMKGAGQRSAEVAQGETILAGPQRDLRVTAYED